MNVLEFAPPPVNVAAIPRDYVARLSVEQYHEMIEAGILQSGDPIELLEGWLVQKMTKNPPHETANGLLQDILPPLIPQGWLLRLQAPITLPDSEPEPDAAIVRGKRQDYFRHHPLPTDVAVVIEVSDSTFQRDRELKQRIYARAGITYYWIVNLLEAQIEVYSKPLGKAGMFKYENHQIYRNSDPIELIIQDKTVAIVTASELLPK